MAQVTPGVIRAQVTFQGASNTAKDRYTNTWHFIRNESDFIEGGLFADMGSFRDEIGERLREFYVEPTAAGSAVGAFLSKYVNRGFDVTVYDLGEVPTVTTPRTPYTTSHTLPPVGWQSSLPFECAVTLSTVAGRNVRRRRGRIFLGPLGAGATEEGASGIPWVSQTVRTTLLEALQRLCSPGTTDQLTPALFSPSDNAARRIDGGWVDAEFDTIRSRQPIAFTRQVWGTADTA